MASMHLHPDEAGSVVAPDEVALFLDSVDEEGSHLTLNAEGVEEDSGDEDEVHSLLHCRHKTNTNCKLRPAC